ncbi:hypothetical protein S40288_11319 [Stachybotrys chartarum IBT 40288]|nr:hypothetical protein S40288_11319 [Stachybotrys chartarum IBT 40288]
MVRLESVELPYALADATVGAGDENSGWDNDSVAGFKSNCPTPEVLCTLHEPDCFGELGSRLQIHDEEGLEDCLMMLSWTRLMLDPRKAASPAEAVDAADGAFLRLLGVW